MRARVIKRYAKAALRLSRRVPDHLVSAGDLAGRVGRTLALVGARARLRRDWSTEHPPHFTDFRWVATEFAFGTISPGSFNRAFFSAELIHPGDRLLDIGCGDGFADRRLYSEKCSLIDAIDIEPAAIATARERNPASNVTYHLADAVNVPFPRTPYDVIVWDGAIGHFDPQTVALMLAKIRDALAPGGVFTGSEALGRTEGAYDHLGFFDTLDDLTKLLRPLFPHVRIRELDDPLPDGTHRREAYWRAGPDAERLDPWTEG